MPIIAPGIGQPTGFSIGRVGKTLNIPDPMMWKNASYGSTIRGQGGDIVVEGMISGLTPSQALVVRDQFLGYQDNWDEPIVPVVVASEPRLTGYYQVTGVQVDTDPLAVGLGILNWTVGLQPVNGFAQPQFESVISGALLTNVVGAVTTDAMPFHAVAAASSQYQNSINAYTPTVGTRSSADGNLTFAYRQVPPANITALSGLAPASFYIGAATFEQGSPLQPVVGRTMAQPDLVNWRLSNGLVRVTPNGSVGKFDFSWYNGSTWSAVKTFQITNLTPALAALVILRNGAEEVVIRLSYTQGGGSIATLDLALRRGDNLVRMFLTCTIVQTWALKRDVSEAATAITYGAVTLGGFRATANDAAGNRYVMLSYQTAMTSNLATGQLVSTGSTISADYAVGSEIGGSGAVTPDDATSLARQYIAALSESQRIVQR